MRLAGRRRGIVVVLTGPRNGFVGDEMRCSAWRAHFPSSMATWIDKEGWMTSTWRLAACRGLLSSSHIICFRPRRVRRTQAGRLWAWSFALGSWVLGPVYRRIGGVEGSGLGACLASSFCSLVYHLLLLFNRSIVCYTECIKKLGRQECKPRK